MAFDYKKEYKEFYEIYLAMQGKWCQRSLRRL